MGNLVRFGISLDDELLAQFDKTVAQAGLKNRSEAIRDLIRDSLVKREWEVDDGEKVGTITIIYDHHMADVGDRLTKLEHDNHGSIISKMHIHLDHDHCLEVLAVRGKSNEIRRLADEIIGTKGVKHGQLVATTTGKELK